MLQYISKSQMSSQYNLYYPFPSFFFNLPPVYPQIPYQSQIYSPVILNQFPVAQAPPTTASWPPSNSNLAVLRQPEAEEGLKTKKKVWRIPQMRQQGRKRDEVFCQRNQNKDRNLISYILKGFIHLIFQSREIAELAKLASQKLSLPNGVSSFFQFIQDRFPSKKTYVGLRYMKSLIDQAKEDPMSQVLAITLRYFLKNSYKLIVLQKPHTSKKNKLKLLKKTKELCALMFQK